MRQVRFRALAIVNDKHAGIKVGDFVYGHYIESGCDAPCIIFGDGEQIEVDKNTLGQLTGLQDKNVVDIYEGDILAHTSTRRAGYQKDGVTIYKKIVYGQANPDNSVLSDYIGFWAVSLPDVTTAMGGSIEYQTESHGAVVIGNIHQNPELIKRGES